MQDKTVESLSAFLIKISKIYFGVICAVIAGGIYRYSILLQSPDKTNPQTLSLPIGTILIIVDLSQLFFAAFVFINFLRFLYRISDNLINKHDVALKDSPGWTVAYFFIPILNLYEPYVAIKAMWDNLKESNNIRMLNFWWALRVICMVISIVLSSYIVFSFGKSNSTLTSAVYLISDSISLLSTFLLIKVIHSLSKAYNDKYGSETETNISVS